jgi:hypothetical protein
MIGLFANTCIILNPCGNTQECEYCIKNYCEYIMIRTQYCGADKGEEEWCESRADSVEVLLSLR